MEHDKEKQAPYLLDRFRRIMGDLYADYPAGSGKWVEKRHHIQLPEVFRQYRGGLGRYTTMPYKGNPTNRRIEFKEADLSGIKMAFPEIEYCSATISQTDTISYGEEYIVGDLRGVSEDYNSIIYINVASQNGRFINKMDMNATRKVIILSPVWRKCYSVTRTRWVNT